VVETKPLLIGGRWVDGRGLLPNINPSDTADVVAEFAHADQALAQQAVEAAHQAQAAWARATPYQRFDVLDRAGAEVLARAAELGDLLAREEGKTLPEATAEATRAGQILKFFAGEALRLTGDQVDSVRPGVEVTVTREPLGVVSVITPWNFPLAIPAWKIAPALAFGNAVVFKPAELVPGCGWALADVLVRAGLPEGVLNLVVGSGREVGPVLTENPLVDGVTFTGSVVTGELVLRAAQTHRARVQLEMGGKNPLVICDDADLDVAVDVAMQGSFGSTGQRCTASSRLVVMDTVHDQFVDALSRAMTSWVVDDARKPGTQMGPVVDASQLEQDERYLRVAKGEGADVVGGRRVRRDTEGYYLQPALLVGTTNDMTVNREEVFGPVASVIRVGDFEEAVHVANDTEYGLSSGVVTTSLARASHFRRASTAGMVMVNLPTAGVDFHVPFGGRRASSYGSREQGSYAREFFTTVKTAYVAPGAP
jgi:aldehyde dehydrogenase (NAD+)